MLRITTCKRRRNLQGEQGGCRRDTNPGRRTPVALHGGAALAATVSGGGGGGKARGGPAAGRRLLQLSPCRYWCRSAGRRWARPRSTSRPSPPWCAAAASGKASLQCSAHGGMSGAGNGNGNGNGSGGADGGQQRGGGGGGRGVRFAELPDGAASAAADAAAAAAAAATAASRTLAALAAQGGPAPDSRVMRRMSSTVRRLTLEWRDLGCEYDTAAGPRTLLQRRRQERVAGRAGQAQAGGPADGAVLVDGAPRVEAAFLRRSAYVPQDDRFLPTLTAGEVLSFYGALVLPAAAPPRRPPPAARRRRCREVLGAMGLARQADTLVGGVLPGGLLLRGLSGGERKRLAITTGIVAAPSALLLDEPTSGLDASAALGALCVRYMRALADVGHVVLASVHQPRAAIWGMFTQLVVLSRGRMLYSGDCAGTVPWFASPPPPPGPGAHNSFSSYSLSPGAAGAVPNSPSLITHRGSSAGGSSSAGGAPPLPPLATALGTEEASGGGWGFRGNKQSVMAWAFGGMTGAEFRSQQFGCSAGFGTGVLGVLPGYLPGNTALNPTNLLQGILSDPGPSCFVGTDAILNYFGGAMREPFWRLVVILLGYLAALHVITFMALKFTAGRERR
ncbi:hypothetical protein HYH02_000423 [Chlamydomonas schloesseri]|uniref:ABC transporter domain-containing protein n=1 Tax=Chlamydomonas schloesseri TaxID=2026947 RepID=A0A836BCN1_9CHLO|nr:hypothetical protein HYH02_000423 [Chlamydomonas schloesseri]|eukprot:KAG2454581.1 hypothetical protein HYH02_000423 [Chlamydomonas schloesseri]